MSIVSKSERQANKLQNELDDLIAAKQKIASALSDMYGEWKASEVAYLKNAQSLIERQIATTSTLLSQIKCDIIAAAREIEQEELARKRAEAAAKKAKEEAEKKAKEEAKKAAEKTQC